MIVCLGTDEATELLQRKPQRGKRRPWDARNSIFRLGIFRLRAGSSVGRQQNLRGSLISVMRRFRGQNAVGISVSRRERFPRLPKPIQQGAVETCPPLSGNEGLFLFKISLTVLE